jgi:hypothetical protein
MTDILDIACRLRLETLHRFAEWVYLKLALSKGPPEYVFPFRQKAENLRFFFFRQTVGASYALRRQNLVKVTIGCGISHNKIMQYQIHKKLSSGNRVDPEKKN